MERLHCITKYDFTFKGTMGIVHRTPNRRGRFYRSFYENQTVRKFILSVCVCKQVKMAVITMSQVHRLFPVPNFLYL